MTEWIDFPETRPAPDSPHKAGDHTIKMIGRLVEVRQHGFLPSIFTESDLVRVIATAEGARLQVLEKALAFLRKQQR